jgi:poly(A) polymerase
LKRVIQAAKRLLKRAIKTKVPLVTIPAQQHQLSKHAFQRRVLEIIQALKNAGYHAYIVGGGVRDPLCGLIAKDFDIATDAHPEQVRKIIRNSRIIGRRFRLIHVFFGKEVIEVATFRAQHDNQHRSEHGIVVRDNTYGTIEEDALRRDFTINALYYDPDKQIILDYVNGYYDLTNKIIRLIGNPQERYREDPVRILRAIRFLAKTGFKLAPETEAPIKKLAPLLSHISAARLYDEFSKLFLTGHAQATLIQLQAYDLLKWLFPATTALLSEEKNAVETLTLLQQTCFDTDARLQIGKRVTPAFFLAAFLWFPFQHLISHEGNNYPRQDQIYQYAKMILAAQHRHTTMPAYVSQFIQEIWFLQYRLARIRPSQAEYIVNLRTFRAGFDFLILRAKVATTLKQTNEAKTLNVLVDFWEKYQHADENERKILIKQFPKSNLIKRNKRKRKVNKSTS